MTAATPVLAPPAAAEGAVAPPAAPVAPTRLRDRPLGSAMWALRREFMWCGIFSLFANVLLLTSTVYMLQVYDRVLLSGSLLTLAAISLIAFFFYSVMGFSDWLRSRLMVRVSARLDDALSSRTFRAAFEAQLKRPGKSPMQAFADLTVLRQFVTGNGVFAFFDAPWAPIYIGVLFMMNPWLGWTGIAFAALMIALTVMSHRATAAGMKKAGEAQADSNAYLISKIRNAEVVEAMGMLGALRAHWIALHEKAMAMASAAQVRARRYQTGNKVLQYAQQSLILSVGALLVLDGQIGVGAMIACNALLGNALRPLSLIVNTWKMAFDAREAYRRLDSMLMDNPERPEGHAPGSVTGQITLRGLRATAAERKTPILHDLDFEFRAGEVVGIVGPSGAGKSTLARCLVGICPGVRGQVLLDGVALDEWSREALGPHLGYLPQDIEMLDGTIAENIARFGQVEPQRVIEAAARTGIHDMILRLPKGYDTPMGEAGGLLSGGQRQRIGLARALYGEPSVVVLDEPNANLDDAGEAALLRAVRDLRSQGKTVFMIVHQANLLSAADRVLVLDAGRIVQVRTAATSTALTETQS